MTKEQLARLEALGFSETTVTRVLADGRLGRDPMKRTKHTTMDGRVRWERGQYTKRKFHVHRGAPEGPRPGWRF